MADILEMMSSVTNTSYPLPSFTITPSNCGATYSKALVLMVGGAP
jgi:hypothetical protein